MCEGHDLYGRASGADLPLLLEAGRRRPPRVGLETRRRPPTAAGRLTRGRRLAATSLRSLALRIDAADRKPQANEGSTP
jgi:hypothetical protein